MLEDTRKSLWKFPIWEGAHSIQLLNHKHFNLCISNVTGCVPWMSSTYFAGNATILSAYPIISVVTSECAFLMLHYDFHMPSSLPGSWLAIWQPSTRVRYCWPLAWENYKFLFGDAIRDSSCHGRFIQRTHAYIQGVVPCLISSSLLYNWGSGNSVKHCKQTWWRSNELHGRSK
jgi:hypothetical protein